MKRKFRLFTFPLVVLATLMPPVVEHCLAQETTAPVAAQPGVVLVKLTPPVYPRIAQTAHISGEVDVVLGIRQDGSVESAKAVSGPPLLRQAGLNSAQQSQFQCTGCREAVTSYSLAYTFHLVDVGCCATTEELAKFDRQYGPLPRVIQSQNQITLTDETSCICDYAAETPRKVRTAKCLYLWRCGYR